jgi:maltose alpha-D-glucosyltransferase/alpha-amylase
MIDRTDVYWYKDAIIYQLHVKSFFDSTNDGIGDFCGLGAKLDYIKDLGATAIWLMPFYPSPLRDDGYDISDYKGIHPAYGTLRDFKFFVRAAHERGLRIITELVINHTSDQHPWFKRARAAKPGSAARRFYVWSDSDQRYKDAPIVFLDTEKSNWTWDEEAKAFYWHRFYAHQPDLDFDNPRVVGAVLEVMRFWLDLGVDGLRLDAVPYLVEREGTTCENLPETHAIVRKIRAALDAAYPDRVLIAEANLWPEDTAQYFGTGDECHLAFHFPLMPRIYMALAQEDRHPITDILRQTPEIPETAQWAIFLRNHDEMTLAMVTDKERDYLWSFYAADRRARIHLGIRRRLAPLLENDRRKIELLNSLLLSMPGTPVVYYGDEIGMGDNIYLGDRDGVRTPMQWSPDRNGGFSRADPASLFLPAIQDPIYGYSAVNVEAQLANPWSLLTWMRRMIAVRRAHMAFGRGALRFLYPSNRKVLAYLRETDTEKILCVVNVSRAPQAVELDLSEFASSIPIELTAGSLFPAIGARPYLLTLPAYGFFWFRIEPAREDATADESQPTPELFTLVATGKLETILLGRELAAFERNVAPRFLRSRRWAYGITTEIESVKVRDFAVLRDRAIGRFVLPLLDIAGRGGETCALFTPLAADVDYDETHVLAHAVAILRRGALTGILYDVHASPGFGPAILAALRRGDVLGTAHGGKITFVATANLGVEPSIDASDVHRVGSGHRHLQIVLANQLMLKIYRYIEEGPHPEVEMLHYLNEVAHYPHTPLLLGVVEHRDASSRATVLATLQSFMRSQGDAWSWTLGTLKRLLESLCLAPQHDHDTDQDAYASYVPRLQRLGQRTAEMHKALASTTDDPAFAIEPLSGEDVENLVEEARVAAAHAFDILRDLHEFASEEIRAETERLLGRKEECIAVIDTLGIAPIGAVKTRIHGSFDLGQVLIVKDDIAIVGFGTGPGPFRERRKKSSPMQDVAAILCSFAYAAAAARREVAKLLPDPSQGTARLRDQLVEFSVIFVSAYIEAAEGSPIHVVDQTTRRSLLLLCLFSKALRAIDGEASARQEAIDGPVEALNCLLDYLGKSAAATTISD